MITANNYITIDKDIQSGKPIFKGTRVPVESLIDHLEQGITIDDFLEDFPTVQKEQVIAVLKLQRELKF